MYVGVCEFGSCVPGGGGGGGGWGCELVSCVRVGGVS